MYILEWSICIYMYYTTCNRLLVPALYQGMPCLQITIASSSL